MVSKISNQVLILQFKTQSVKSEKEPYIMINIKELNRVLSTKVSLLSNMYLVTFILSILVLCYKD